ncbi:hypothetical protein PLESTF_000022500 [Pleodorina starrii]|nr:hypothetical protein PLESTF_000022500 [Pleodorina starrii]
MRSPAPAPQPQGAGAARPRTPSRVTLLIAPSELPHLRPSLIAGAAGTAGGGPLASRGPSPRLPQPAIQIGGCGGGGLGGCSGGRSCGVLLWAAPTRGSGAAATGGALRAARQPTVMVVESPTKAKKIQEFLGDQYKVLASYGHVRDLPSRDGSVRPEQDFALEWQLLPAAGPRVEEIAGAAEGAPLLLLATDPDREGEAICWHIEQELRRRGVLQRVGSVRRITFTEITRSAITAALQAGRQVSQPLVDAYLARRALDYLVGFHLSPVLWRKLPGAKSAGRVQSVALRLVCEREAAVERFTPTPYWSLDVQLSSPSSPPKARAEGGAAVRARLTHVDGRRLGPLDVDSGEMAQELAGRIMSGPVVVTRVATRQVQRHPSAPFTTASLQQEASRRLGFGAARTMRLAQQLYEGAGTGEGLITYMRTDGVQMSAEAMEELRKANEAMYGGDAVQAQPRQYKSRAKNAQEAHEAIRPTRPATVTPASLPPSLDADLRALYDLIWRRAVASQMTSAVYDVVTVEYSADGGSLTLRSSASLIRQPGFLRAYEDLPAAEPEDDTSSQQQQAEGGGGSGNEDVAALAAVSLGRDQEGQDNRGPAAELLLALQVGSPLRPGPVSPCQHSTRPPARFTEASLVKALEERGIGRPSTYAPIMSLLQDRGYVVREGRSLLPTSLGRVLCAFLEHYFPTYVDYDFTSHVEGQLDDVAGGRAAWRAVLSAFWSPFNAAVASMGAIRTTQCGRGRLVLKPSRYGGFIGCSLYADEAVQCDYARPMLRLSLTAGGGGGELLQGTSTDSEGEGSDGQSSSAAAAANATERLLGRHPQTGEPVWVRLGPYGLYVQLGDTAPKAPKDKKTKPKKKAAAVAAGAGKRGRKAKQGVAEAEGEGEGEAGNEEEEEKAVAQAAKPKRAAIPKAKGLTLHSVTLPQALGLLALPRELGPHPEDGLPVVANTGPFGPYVAHNGISASLGKWTSPMDVDLATAVQLLAAKRARQEARVAQGLPPTRGRGGRGRGRATASTAAARKGAGADGGAAAAAAAAAGRAAKGGVKSAAAAAGAVASSSQRSKSGYILFLQRRWQEIKSTAGAEEVPYREAVSRIAAEWRALGDEGQRRFGGMAASSESGSEADESVKAAAVAATAGRKRPAARAAAPTAVAVAAAATSRPNPYIRFCQQRRPALRAAHPGASLGEMSRLLGAEWGELSEQQKAAYL